MAHTFHDALLPVVNLAKPAADAEKAAEGDTILPQILHFYLVNTVFLQLIIIFSLARCNHYSEREVCA